MTSLLVELVPLILGAALAPLWIIIVLLMLASPRGVVKASAFVLGMTAVRLVQGLVFGIILGGAAADTADSSGKSPIVATLLLVVGILLLVAAFVKWRKEPDPDDPPPKWMASIDEATPLRSLGIGATMIAVGPKLWVFTLSAIAVISVAGLGQRGGTVAYLLYILFAQSLLLLAILTVIVAPQGSRAVLQRAITWLTANNRPISIGASLIFGIYFALDGARGLMGL